MYIPGPTCTWSPLLRVATSTQLFPRLTYSPNLGFAALLVFRVLEQMAQPSLLFWLQGPGSQPLFLPTACLAPHTTLFLSLGSVTLPSRDPAYP